VGRGLAAVAVGAVLGTAAALAVRQLIAGILYRVSPIDPLTYGLVLAVLAAGAAAASVGPAARCVRHDPLRSLRHE
jgi:ABC-type lipoprotein release transport system permease subunit